jgi:hypothetical protein
MPSISSPSGRIRLSSRDRAPRLGIATSGGSAAVRGVASMDGVWPEANACAMLETAGMPRIGSQLAGVTKEG